MQVYLREWAGAFLVAVALAGDVLAAGPVEMQVEPLVKNAFGPAIYYFNSASARALADLGK